MKSKKIFTITIAVIALIAGAMLVCSKAIEKAWTTPENTRNNLTANSENITTSETAFDYPYTVLTPEIFINIGESEEEATGHFDFIETEEGKYGRMTYQQAVNMAGELIKDIYGDTTPQTTPLFVYMQSLAKGKEYDNKGLSLIVTTNVGQREEETEYTIKINPFSGKIKSVVYYNGAIPAPPEGKSLLDYTLTEQQAKDIFYSEICALLKLFGEESTVKDFRLLFDKESDDSLPFYNIFVKCENGEIYCFTYQKVDQLLFQFSPVNYELGKSYGIDW